MAMLNNQRVTVVLGCSSGKYTELLGEKDYPND